MQEVSWLAENRSASQEELCYMEYGAVRIQYLKGRNRSYELNDEVKAAYQYFTN